MEYYLDLSLSLLRFSQGLLQMQFHAYTLCNGFIIVKVWSRTCSALSLCYALCSEWVQVHCIIYTLAAAAASKLQLQLTTYCGAQVGAISPTGI